MIADAIGVTKAAVYQQFKSKDDVVLAVTATESKNCTTIITSSAQQH
jgi:AcrR family transcriptional regulator